MLRYQYLRLEATRIPGLTLVGGYPVPGENPQIGPEASVPVRHTRELRRLSPEKQTRLNALMDGANESTLTVPERTELERLIDEIEELELENARKLVLDRQDRRNEK